MSPVLRRIVSLAILIAVVGGVAALSFQAGYTRGTEFPKHITVEGVENIEGDEAADFGTFWQAWDLISEKHLQGSTYDAEARVYGAIDGLVHALDDPNSDFFSPPDSAKFQEDIRGSFGGIGAEIAIRDGQLLIVAPLKGTPADRAGLKPQDRILQVDDTPTGDLSIDEAVKIIRGPSGSAVKLLILRDGWDEPREFSVTRAEIVVPTLEYEFKGNVMHLKLLSFNANARTLFAHAMRDAESKGIQGMILDLRNNPGGFLGVAVDIAGWFLPQGALVVREEGTGGIQEFLAQGSGKLKELPVVVIINSGSASASEILAGTLRDQRNAKLVGEQSFGKGTVQEIIPLRDGSSLKLTIAHWVLPSGMILADEGLVPDVEVELTDEDAENERDPQLEKALELLQVEMNGS